MRISRCWQLVRNGRHMWCLRVDTDQSVISVYPGWFRVARRWRAREAVIRDRHAAYGCANPQGCTPCRSKENAR